MVQLLNGSIGAIENKQLVIGNLIPIQILPLPQRKPAFLPIRPSRLVTNLISNENKYKANIQLALYYAFLYDSICFKIAPISKVDTLGSNLNERVGFDQTKKL